MLKNKDLKMTIILDLYESYVHWFLNKSWSFAGGRANFIIFFAPFNTFEDVPLTIPPREVGDYLKGLKGVRKTSIC